MMKLGFKTNERKLCNCLDLVTELKICLIQKRDGNIFLKNEESS